MTTITSVAAINSNQLDSAGSSVVVNTSGNALLFNYVLFPADNATGTTNQNIIWNSTIPSEIDLSERRQTEIHFDSKGKIQILGYPSKKTLTELEKRHGRLRSLTRDI